MESQQQSQGGKGFSGLTAIILVVVAFAGGVYVGIHPQWIPISTNGGVTTATGVRSTTQPSDDRSTPTTAPSSTQN